MSNDKSFSFGGWKSRVIRDECTEVLMGLPPHSYFTFYLPAEPANVVAMYTNGESSDELSSILNLPLVEVGVNRFTLRLPVGLSLHIFDSQAIAVEFAVQVTRAVERKKMNLINPDEQFTFPGFVADPIPFNLMNEQDWHEELYQCIMFIINTHPF